MLLLHATAPTTDLAEDLDVHTVRVVAEHPRAANDARSHGCQASASSLPQLLVRRGGQLLQELLLVRHRSRQLIHAAIQRPDVLQAVALQPDADLGERSTMTSTTTLLLLAPSRTLPLIATTGTIPHTT